ncbi:sensor histidine kinase [Chryseobacterium sp. T1]
MNLLKNWKYHLFTYVFFVSIIFFFLTFRKLIYTEIYSDIYINFYIFELFYVSALLYIISNIIIYFIELVCPTQILTFRNIILVILITVVLHIIFQIILWPSLMYAQQFFSAKSDLFVFTPRQTLDKQIVNFFYFLFMTFNWLIFIYAYKIYQSNQQELEQKLTIEKNLKEANLNTLKGQINPHFIFNSLNNIRGLVQEDPIKSKEMITRLSELLRSSLLSDKTNTVSLEQEIETVDNFLEISKIQYEERLQFSMDISPETRDFQVPPMILQMLVENAVKHGISRLKNGGSIVIKTFLEDDYFNLLVKNTGQINQQESGTKIGIKNIEERLRLLYDNQASFNLTENESDVIAQIRINKSQF